MNNQRRIFRYKTVKPKQKAGLQTTSRSAGGSQVGMRRFSKMNEFILKLFEQHKEHFIELEFDPDTIKFEIYLLPEAEANFTITHSGNELKMS